MAKCTGVRSQTQIALYQERLRDEGNRDCGQGGQQGDRRAQRIEPDDSAGGENNFEDVAQQLAAEIRQAPDEMDAMAALGHIRFQAALEISIAQVWNLTQESLAKADFEAAASA